MRALTLSLLHLVVFSSLAQGQTRDELADAEARARFEAGELAYASGRFEDALIDFQRAYELSERPELLYNIGLTADRLRQDELAIASLEQFLERLPSSPKAEQARGRLRLIRANAVRETGTHEGSPTEAPDEMSEHPPGTAERRVAGPWVMGLAGGALVAVGAVLLGTAIAEKRRVEDDGTPRPWPEIQEAQDTVPRRSAIGISMVAVGGAAALGAVLWRVMLPEAPVDVAVAQNRISLQGSF